MFINYFKLKAYIKDLGFDDFQAKEAIKKIRKMDREIKRAFATWFNKKTLPDIEVENFSISELIDKLNMNHIKAFLFLDWLKKDPIAAKRALAKLSDFIIVPPELKAKLEEKLSESGVQQEVEDTSDIEVEESVSGEK